MAKKKRNMFVEAYADIFGYDCPICGEYFVRDKSLQKHIDQVHAGRTQTLGNNPAGLPGTAVPGGYSTPVGPYGPGGAYGGSFGGHGHYFGGGWGNGPMGPGGPGSTGGF